MLGRLDPPAGPALEQLAEIHRQRALLRRTSIQSPVAAARLQARSTPSWASRVISPESTWARPSM
jgi:hypothetical protein